MNTENSTQQTVLRFRLNSRQLFGFNVLKIREIVHYRVLNVIPGSHAAVAGTFELRGTTVPVIDLSAAIGQKPIAKESLAQSTIIVAEFNRCVQGFLVGSVDKITAVDWSDIKEVPIANGRNHYVNGVLNVDDTLISILDLEKVLHEVVPQVNEEDMSGILEPDKLAQIAGRKVLAVDDSAVARNLLSKAMDALSLDYLVASNGKEALELLEDEQTDFDMVISDIEMPEMDGYALTRELRSNTKIADKYVLLHSSLSGNACEGIVKEVGADALLTKFQSEELAQAIYHGLSRT